MNKTSFTSGLLGGLLAVAALWGMGTAWTQAGYEGAAGTPGTITNATAADQIDDYIRDERQEIRYRAEVEHFWGDGTVLGYDNGLHRLGSARCYMSNAAPTVLSDSHPSIPGIGASIADYLNTSGASFSGEVDLDDPASLSAGLIEDDVGHGRCWIDLDGPDDTAGTSDDNKLYTFIGVAGAANGAWTAVDAAARPDGDDEILAGSYNIIYNGSFEATDGTGAATSTTVPDGWTLTDAGGGNPTFVYTNPSDDVLYGDGYHLEVTDVGGAGGDLIYQTLNVTGAKVWKVIARSYSPAGDTCRLNTTGAAANLADQDNALAAWTTLSGTFTSAAPDAVNINLTTVTLGGDCYWDHVAVYPVGDVATDRPEVSQPGVWRVRGEYPAGSGDIMCQGTYGVGNCAEANTGLYVTVTAPTDGSAVVLLDMHVYTEDDDIGNNCEVRMQDVTNVDTLMEYVLSDSNTSALQHTQHHHSILSQTAGATVVYAAQIRDSGAGPAYRCDLNDTYDSWIEAVIIPTR